MKISLPDASLPTTQKTGIVIMVHNRPEYVRLCFESVRKSDLSDVVFVVFDDASDNAATKKLIEDFSIPGIPVVKISLSQHKRFNIHENLKFAFDWLLMKYRCTHLGVLDSDTLVKPNWLRSMRALLRLGKVRHGQCIVSGFNCWAKHRGFPQYDHYILTQRVGGASMLFEACLYERMRPCLVPYWDDQIIRSLGASVAFLISRPSLVQHVGKTGLFSSRERYMDTAKDFYPFTQKIQWGLYLRYLWGWYFTMPFLFFKRKLKLFYKLS